MSAISTRKSVQAIVKETTAGTPVDPTSGTQVISLQEGFDVSPAFETIDNIELSPSVDSKAPIIGIENPTSSIGHYFRHSGVEATRPNYDVLLEAALGIVTAAPTEVATTTASTSGDINTRAVIKLASGGSNFERGSAILLKDSTNGYIVRNVYDTSGNDLTMLFNLGQDAPASGVNTGRHILYKTSDEPPALTHHIYRGNGGAYEVITGARVATATINAEAGQPLNMEFSLNGTGYYFNPIRVEDADRYLDFDLGDAEFNASVNAKLYKSPHELASALEDAMENTGATGTFTVQYHDQGASSGKYSLQHSGSTFNLLWNTGTNTANTIGDAIGFSVAADDTGATTYTSDNELSWVSPYSQTADSDANPLVVKNNLVQMGTFNRTACANAQSFTLNINNELTDVTDICAESGISEKLLTGRVTDVQIVMNLQKHDSKSFEQFRLGDTVQFSYVGGTKVGGNWVAGKVVNVCIVEARISEWQITGDEFVTISATLQLVGNASGEQNLFVNML
jgi:hypothetical protein